LTRNPENPDSILRSRNSGYRLSSVWFFTMDREAFDQLVRRTIEGLPAHLRPGGTCVILCIARDTHNQAFEQRARDPTAAGFPQIVQRPSRFMRN
jgi:hypothetical protein